jgi:hypothetical protein
MAGDDKTLDFFISYSSLDERWATWIGWILEEEGYAVALQAWDFRPGSNFVLEMHQAALSARRTLLVLSPNFTESSFTAPEWAAAFSADPTGAERLVIPVRVEEVKVSGLLKQIVWIDLLGLAPDDARARLGRVPYWVVDGVAEPDPDRCHGDGSAVDVVALVVAGGHGAVGAELVDCSLDGVAVAVMDLVEAGWSAAA